VCRQFDGLTVQVAPAGQAVSALAPYWDLDLIARPQARYRTEQLVSEAFTAERGGVALSLLAVNPPPLRSDARYGLFRGDLVKLTLPDPGPGSRYPRGRFDAAHLGDAGMLAGSNDLRTPRVAEALFFVCSAFGAAQALGAISENLLYLAVPLSRQAQRTARVGLWRRVSRCEPAIRAALAQLNAVLQLTDAVAEACAHPAAQSAWAGGAAIPAALFPQKPSAWRSVALIGAVIGVLMGVIALEAVYAPHPEAPHPDLPQTRQAAEAGDASAQMRLGVMYLDGDRVDRDYAAAMQWFQKAADQGNTDAQTYIGLLYQYGDGVARDYAEAMRWYRKAADQGNASAQNNIGGLNQNGWGVAQDYAEAMRWYRKAADSSNARAQYHIGTLYANGWGVLADPGEARVWMQRAAVGGDPDAKKWLAAQ
jgi:hypothetical protein